MTPVTPVLLDTTVYSHSMRGTPAAVRAVREAPLILVSPIVVGELIAGFRRGSRQARNRAQLKAFLAKERVRLVVVSQATAEHYAAIVDQLRSAGTPIPTNDTWIAACAMENGAAVTTSDPHFTWISGLLVDLLHV